MADEVTPATPMASDLQYEPAAVVPPSNAVRLFMDWLNSRNQQAGPFGAFWGPEHGQALVKEFCDKQGW